MIPDADLDLLAAYAIGAVDTDDVLLVEAQLASDAARAEAQIDLRSAGEAFAAATVAPVPAPSALRGAVLTAALTARPGVPVTPTSHPETFLAECHHLLDTLRSIPPELWDRPVDPPEFAGWTVADVVAHVAGTQSLTAETLGVRDPAIPETDTSNEGRTAQVQARHRNLSPAEAIDELARLTDRIEGWIDGADEELLETYTSFWGLPLRNKTLLIHRSFETWIHHRDICRAVGLPVPVTSSRSLVAMSSQAAIWAPIFLGARGEELGDAVATIDLTGPGGGTHVVAIGAAPPAVVDPDASRFTLHMDVIDFCLSIGDRRPPGGFPFTTEGDADLAGALVESLPLLATL